MNGQTTEVVGKLKIMLSKGHSWETFLAYNRGVISKRAARNVLCSLIPANYELRPIGCADRMAACFLFEEVFELYLDHHRSLRNYWSSFGGTREGLRAACKRLRG